jgi:hypothetical protein
MATQQRTRGRRISGMSRAAWLLVLLMMLAAAAWSISGTLIGWGMKSWLAYGLSLMFDAAGLICADYARRAVERGTAAGLPRLALLGFVAVSAALNWSHGQRIGGTVAGIGLASISAAVELLFELHRRDVRDEQRAAAGLVAERLPYIPLVGWMLFPVVSYRTIRGAVGQRLDALADGPTTQPSPAPQRGAVAVPTTPAAAPPTPPATSPAYSDDRCAIIRGLYDAGTRPSTSSMRAALVAAGYRPPADSIIRGQLRALIETREPHLADLPPETLPLRKAAP